MKMSSTLMMLIMRIRELWMTIGSKETKDIQQSRKSFIVSFMNKEEQLWLLSNGDIMKKCPQAQNLRS
jgi:hypothetical protein